MPDSIGAMRLSQAVVVARPPLIGGGGRESVRRRPDLLAGPHSCAGRLDLRQRRVRHAGASTRRAAGYRYTLDQADSAAGGPARARRPAATPGTSSATTTSSPTAFNHGYIAALEPGPRSTSGSNYAERGGSATTPAASATSTSTASRATDALRRPRRRASDVTRDFGAGYSRTRTQRRRAVRGRRTRLRAVRRRPAAAARRHAAQHRRRSRTQAVVVRVLGREPVLPGPAQHPGLGRPVWDRRRDAVGRAAAERRRTPTRSTIFAAALTRPGRRLRDRRRRSSSAAARARARGRRRRPADRLDRGAGAPTAKLGQTLFVVPLAGHARAGQDVTLRYAYGQPTPTRDPGAGRQRYRARPTPTRAGARVEALAARRPPSARARAGSRASCSGTPTWCARHDVRGAAPATTSSPRAATTSTTSASGAFRDPLQHVLPMIYCRPELAREVIRYSAGEQRPRRRR